MKRFWIFLTVIALLFACTPASVSAAAVQSGTCGENLTWTLDAEGTLTISGTGEMTNWICMDEAFNILEVTLAPWYGSEYKIQKVVIQEGVTSIGSAAFHMCDQTEVEIPNSVTSIGSYAFAYSTQLQEITLPESLTYIGCAAFKNCYALESVVIPQSVTEVGDYAFENCVNLTKISFSEYTKNICNSTFTGCENLNFNIYKNAKYLGNDANPYAILIKATDSSATQYTIHPDTKVIALAAFKDLKKLRTVTIPNRVVRIEWGAFAQCIALQSITIPGSVKCIDDSAFYNCTALKTLRLETGLEEIGHSAFYNCDKLSSVSLPAGLKYLGTQAFYDCDALTQVSIPDTVTEIGSSVFAGCDRLTYNTYQDLGNYLGSSANLYYLFMKPIYTDIRDFEVFTSTEIIAPSAFKDCTQLQTVKLPNSMVAIESYAFANCTSLSEITIPEGITAIRYSLFYNCTSLKTVTIPKSVTTIDASAFSGCDALTDVYYSGSKADWEKIDKSTGNDALKNATVHFAEHSHEWDGGVITEKATCAKEGVKTFTCTCGETRTESVAKLTTHTPGKPATATKDQVCTVCGAVLQKATGETKPTEPPTEATVPPTEATTPPTEETEPPTTAPTEPATEATEPSAPETEATEAPQPTEPPTAAPTEPVEVDDEEEDEGSPWWIFAIVGVACFAIGGATVSILLWKKKQ